MANPPLKETEIVFDEESSDASSVGTLRYVNGELHGRDADGVYDLRLGGGGYLTVTASSASTTVTGGTYLSIGGVTTHPANSPPSLPFDGKIVAASVGVDTSAGPGAAWSIEVLVNGVLQLTLSQPSGSATELFDDSLSVDVDAGDRISVRNANAGVNLNKPIVSLVFRLRR